MAASFQYAMPDVDDAQPAQGATYAGLSDEDQLWRRWREQGEQAARDTLAHHYLPYARALAAKAYARRAHDELEFDEYLQFATVGMIESLDRFDPGYGVLFKTFATRRINGAILDGVQALSERYQQVVLSRRIAEERVESFAGEEGESGSSKLALKELAAIGVGLALGFMLDGTGMVESAEAVMPDYTYQRLELRQFRQRMVDVLVQLTDREQEVIRMHYFNGASFDDIARDLDLTKGRISQLHKRAIERLRTMLQTNGGWDIEL